MSLKRFLLQIQAALCCFGIVFADVETKPLAVWDTTFEGTAGFGYRDNVLRSAFAAENSGYFQSSIDASAMRLSETDAMLLFYFFGEDIRYFNAPSVNYEQFFSGTMQGSIPVGERSEAGIQATYLYQHQILDASATEVLVRRVLVLGHSLEIRPAWKLNVNEDWSAELEGIAIRQIYEQELDNYWEGGAGLNLRRSYGHRSEVGISLESVLRAYDTRLQFTDAGVPIPGTDLTYLQTELSGRWTHYWDAERCWRTRSQLSAMMNQDNSSGYFDYDRFYFRQQVQWKNSGWQVSSNLRAGHYLHRLQQIQGESRYRTYTSVDALIERELWQHWKIYASAAYEWNFSNDPRDEYNTWYAGTGVGLEF